MSLKTSLAKNRITIVLFFLTLLSLGIRFYRLDYPESYYFDEIYFAFTAGEMAKGNRAGWESWHTAPKGFAYEWTHPPLGKEIIAAGILMFGDNAFGWRFFQALFGGLGTLVMYLLGKELFQSKNAGVIAALLFSFESLIFTLSRISMVDVFLMSFILLASLFFVKYARTGRYGFLLVSGFFCGAAVSVKWNGVFALGFLGASSFLVALFWQRRLLAKNRGSLVLQSLKTLPRMAAAFILIPVLVYLAVYIPFFIFGNPIGDFINLQENMYGYHRGLDAQHSYSSLWWEWPLLLRSVYMYLHGSGSEHAHIYALGNPLIWWAGCVFLALGTFDAARGRMPALSFTALSVLAYWLPWAVSPRKLTFLYHFLPALPFILLISAYFLASFWEQSRHGKLFTSVFLVIAVCMFVYFYPVLAGIPVLDDSLWRFFWLKGWR